MEVETSSSNAAKWITPNRSAKARKRLIVTPTSINNYFFSQPEVDSDTDAIVDSNATRPFKMPKVIKRASIKSPQNTNKQTR